MNKRELVIARGKLPANVSFREMLPVLGEPFLLPGEDQAEYEALIASLSHAVEPQDTIEWIWIKDITDIVWEMRRLKLLRHNIIDREMASKMAQLVGYVWASWLDKYHAEGLGEQISDHWKSGSDYRRRIALRFLGRRGLGLEDVVSLVYRSDLGELTRIDSIVNTLATRRDRLLQEIERRRSTLAMWLREATDAEFEDVPGKTGDKQSEN
jgi:hypothetical protein